MDGGGLCVPTSSGMTEEPRSSAANWVSPSSVRDVVT